MRLSQFERELREVGKHLTAPTSGLSDGWTLRKSTRGKGPIRAEDPVL
jgi:hypothetical protein